MTFVVVVLLAAFVLTVASAMNKAPLWAAVFCLIVLELFRVLPGR